MNAAGRPLPLLDAWRGRSIRALLRDGRLSGLRKEGQRDPLTSLVTALAAGAAAALQATVEQTVRDSSAALTRAARESGGRCVAPPRPSRR
jgi:hypothetical protein